MVVDYIEDRVYSDIDLDEDPCIFPRCGHMLIVSNMDMHLDMKMAQKTLEPGKIVLEGGRDSQVASIKKSLRSYFRYGKLFGLRNAIVAYMDGVREKEQPFRRVWDLVQSARRRKSNIRGDFNFESGVSQPLFFQWGMALLLRCDWTIIIDFVSLKRADASTGELSLDLEVNREDSVSLIRAAVESRDRLREVEGHLLYAQFAALEVADSPYDDAREWLRNDGLQHVDIAEELCRMHPRETHGMMHEIKQVRYSLDNRTLYTSITSEERRAVVAAMSKEFSVTGHWYNCENGHPFTVGECGQPVETSRCPICGATIGGIGHEAAAGVERARELEREFKETGTSEW